MSDQPAAVPMPPPQSGGGPPLPPGAGAVVQVPPGAPPPAPIPQPEPIEVEMRDHLGAMLATTAIELTRQVAMLSTGEAGACKDMAQATLYLTEALVLVAPIESTGPVAGPGGSPVPLPPKHMPPQASLNTAEQQATGRPS